MKTIATFIISAFAATASFSALGDQTTGEKVEKWSRDTKSDVKKGYHRAKEEACEMVNGKLHCVDEKIKNRATESKDAIKDKAKDVGDNIDND